MDLNGEQEDSISKAVTKWNKSLLDLSLRNRLVSLSSTDSARSKRMSFITESNNLVSRPEWKFYLPEKDEQLVDKPVSALAPNNKKQKVSELLTNQTSNAKLRKLLESLYTRTRNHKRERGIEVGS